MPIGEKLSANRSNWFKQNVHHIHMYLWYEIVLHELWSPTLIKNPQQLEHEYILSVFQVICTRHATPLYGSCVLEVAKRQGIQICSLRTPHTLFCIKPSRERFSPDFKSSVSQFIYFWSFNRTTSRRPILMFYISL